MLPNGRYMMLEVNGYMPYLTKNTWLVDGYWSSFIKSPAFPGLATQGVSNVQSNFPIDDNSALTLCIDCKTVPARRCAPDAHTHRAANPPYSRLKMTVDVQYSWLQTIQNINTHWRHLTSEPSCSHAGSPFCIAHLVFRCRHQWSPP